jgi:hypothetical protein
MAPNFRISIHRNSDNLHLKLIGDFDGTSAYELLNVLKKNCNGVCRVIIHTSCLKNIYPFGREVFRRNLSELNNHRTRMMFTGENANHIAPETSPCL